MLLGKVDGTFYSLCHKQIMGARDWWKWMSPRPKQTCAVSELGPLCCIQYVEAVEPLWKYWSFIVYSILNTWVDTHSSGKL